MKKIAYLCLVVTGLFSLASCAPFRINMGAGFGPHSPGQPAPSGLQEQWVDVSEWQAYLKSIKPLKLLQSPHYPSGVFDDQTVAATIAFQKWRGTSKSEKHPLPVLPATGCVNFATYSKAVREGMPKYNKVYAAACPECSCQSKSGHHHFHGMGMKTMTIGNGENFHIPMKNNCSDTSYASDPQVTDWQKCLVCLGYRTAAPSKTFDALTQLETEALQSDCGLTMHPYVDDPTFQVAQSVTSCKMNVVEVMTSCPPGS